MPFLRQLASSASEERLGKLIEERMKEGANKEAIDRRIWDLFGEMWAVMFTDLSGFSRNVEKFGIVHFLQTIHESHKLFVPCIDDHDGILLKTEGDSMLIIFRKPFKAISCAVELQKICRKTNQGKAPEDEVLLCLGIGYGRILRIGDVDVFGREVNSAAKLGEDTAKPYEILLTELAAKIAKETMGLESEPLEDAPVKGFRLKYEI
jgi:class 3 adenylate cyclase